ncbi:2-oxoacid:acceptor oxidoreductase family protein [Candidatus Uhrbacteria bacterium]|nr:2-oxoacid:acceptor oxidoreductase family protein [Candidatus Uhrbacteria bacterium]
MANFKIVICGEGGQGALSVAEIIAQAAHTQGKRALAMPFFSTEKRGGVSMAFTQISDEPIPYPKFGKADLWVALSQRSVDRIAAWLQPGTKVIVNSFLVKDLSLLKGWEVSEIDAVTVAGEEVRNPRTFNMVIMGAMVGLIPGLDRSAFTETLERHFSSKYEKNPELKAQNEKAFGIGYGLTHK